MNNLTYKNTIGFLLMLVASASYASDGDAGFFFVALPIIFISWILSLISSVVYGVWGKGSLWITLTLLAPAIVLYLIALIWFYNWGNYSNDTVGNAISRYLFLLMYTALLLVSFPIHITKDFVSKRRVVSRKQ